MKKICVLKGRSSCGKSHTLKQVIEILKEKYPNSKYELLISNLNKEKQFVDEKGLFNKLVTPKQELLVGIETQGDPNSRLPDSLNDLEARGCDIIFCASRTRGQTVEAIKSHKNNYEIKFIKQTIVKDDWDKNNTNVAHKLITLAGL